MLASFYFYKKTRTNYKFLSIKYMQFINIPSNIIFALNPQNYKVRDLAE